MHDIGMHPNNHRTQPPHEGPDVHPSSVGIHLLLIFFYVIINTNKHLKL